MICIAMIVTLEMLAQLGLAGLPTCDEEQAMWVACYKGDVNTISSLASPANINQLFAEDGNRTPIHIVSEHGYLRAARFLLERGADPKLVTDRGWTALHLAAINNRADVLQVLLLANEANLAQRDARDCTPLNLALEQGHAGTIETISSSAPETFEVLMRRSSTSGLATLHRAILFSHVHREGMSLSAQSLLGPLVERSPKGHRIASACGDTIELRSGNELGQDLVAAFSRLREIHDRASHTTSLLELGELQQMGHELRAPMIQKWKMPGYSDPTEPVRFCWAIWDDGFFALREGDAISVGALESELIEYLSCAVDRSRILDLPSRASTSCGPAHTRIKSTNGAAPEHTRSWHFDDRPGTRSEDREVRAVMRVATFTIELILPLCQKARVDEVSSARGLSLDNPVDTPWF